MGKNGKSKFDIIKDSLNLIQADVILIKEKVTNIELKSDKHEKVLYGNPEDMGQTGLISTASSNARSITGLGKRIDSIRSTFLLVWTGIFSVIQVAIAFFRGK